MLTDERTKRKTRTKRAPAAAPTTPPIDWASVRPEVTDELLADITRRIVERFHPEKVILFGSYAYGKPHLYSDVDLFVIMESDEGIFERIRQVDEVARVPFLPMDVIVRTPEEVRQRLEMGDFFVAEILSRGKVLYERDGRVGREGRG
jgi:predicted nucleotidyltransferase